MIKVMVVTLYKGFDYCGLHTTIIEFESDSEADEAIERIFRRQLGDKNLSQVCTKLNGIKPC